ncbi:MAG: hypothetical protein GF341_10540 [candidate division Zixibacteria bacterium]|nr:hypothetical protein [candidate division Zixibacteria bacterium]
MRHHRRTTKITIWLTAVTALLWVVYALIGHPMIDAIYHGNAPGFLNSLITSQDRYPVEHFYDAADRVFYRQVLFFPLGMFVFYALVVHGLRFGLRNARTVGSVVSAESARWIRRDWLIGGGLYAVVTLFLFSPILSQFSNHLIGPLEDNVRYLWNMWWAERVLIGGNGSLTFTQMIFFPEGASLYFNDYSWYNLIGSLLLRTVLTPAATYNVLILHSFVLAGLGAFWLVRYITRDSIAGVVGGLLFAFGSAHVAHSLHHMNIASVQFIPFFILFFIKSMRGGRTRDIALAALFFLLSALCSWTFLILNTFVVILAYVYLAYRNRKGWLPRVAGKSIVIVGAPIAILSPWLAPMVWLGVTSSGTAGGGHSGYVVDLVGFVIPNAYHWLNRWDIVASINQSYWGNAWESAGYLGLGSIAIVLAAGRRVWRVSGAWTCALIAFGVMAMGTYVHVAGAKLPIVLPYSPLKNLPPFDTLRAPGRYAIYVQLFWVVIVGFAVRQLVASAHSQRIRLLRLGIIGVLLIGDHFTIRADVTDVAVPPAYHALESTNQPYGILELPGGWTQNGLYMMYQTAHEIPIVQGTIPRTVGSTLQNRLHLDDPDTLHNQLVTHHVRYLVLHRDAETGQWPQDPGPFHERYTEVYRDSAAIVWRVY